MLNPSILVWAACAPNIAEAIKEFQARWRPSSTGNSAHTIRLIREFIDPAITGYAATLPQQWQNYLPGISTEDSFSGIIKRFGLNTMARLQRRLLLTFRATQNSQTSENEQLIATLETLIGLIGACIRKRPAKTKVHDTPLNNARRKGFCQFCDKPAEFTAFSDGNTGIELYPRTKEIQGKQKTRRLSSQYCVDHQPKLADGSWNPEYRKAKRSNAEFILELRRLSLQSSKLSSPCSKSSDTLIDSYIYHYVCMHGFQPADEAALRLHARLMVDAKLTDRKKKIILLQKYAFSQSEIARRLGIPRQHVFRDIASIPDEFRQIPMLRGFQSYFISLLIAE